MPVPSVKSITHNGIDLQAVEGFENVYEIPSEKPDNFNPSQLSLRDRIWLAVSPSRNPYSPLNLPLTLKRKRYYQFEIFNNAWLAGHLRGSLTRNLEKKLEEVVALDFACGEGRQMALLSQIGVRSVFGHDRQIYDTWKSDTWKSIPATFIRCQAQKASISIYKDSVFDLVLNYEILMYLHDSSLENHVKDMARILKRGGLLLIEDRNEYEISGRMFDPSLQTHGDCRIRNVVDGAGLEVVESSTYGMTSAKAWSLWSRLWTLTVPIHDFGIAVPYPRDRLGRYLFDKVDPIGRPLRFYVCRKN